MGRRRQPRVKGILPVRIWGTDCGGQTFVEHGCTANISGAGTSLLGVNARLTVGDVISLQYRNRQAQFRIAWIVPASTASENHIGLECLQPGKDLWPVTLPGEEPDTYLPSRALHKPHGSRGGRRCQTRFPIFGTAYITKPGTAEGSWVNVADISLNGCYLETSNPKNVGRTLKLLLRIGHSELEALGVVRVRYPGVAMGIEFTFMSNAGRRTLERWINHFKEFDSVSR